MWWCASSHVSLYFDVCHKTCCCVAVFAIYMLLCSVVWHMLCYYVVWCGTRFICGGMSHKLCYYVVWIWHIYYYVLGCLIKWVIIFRDILLWRLPNNVWIKGVLSRYAWCHIIQHTVYEYKWADTIHGWLLTIAATPFMLPTKSRSESVTLLSNLSRSVSKQYV